MRETFPIEDVRRRCETLEDCVARLGAPVAPLGIDGRCGRRLAALLALLRSVAQVA